MMQVSVYKNLHKGCFSIRACEGPAKGRVIAHADEVALVGVAFHVGKLGQTQVRKSGHKNVHAFVTGHLVGWGGPKAFAYGIGAEVLAPNTCGDWTMGAAGTAQGAQQRGEPFTYNPYKHDGFVSKMDGRIVKQASRALLSTVRGTYAEITASERGAA